MKDPAALLYIDKFLIATVDMDSDCVGWYIKLLLHQYDKGDLPNDTEKLAQLCNVRFSEFTRFKQVLEQVLMQKMVLNDKGRLENPFATEVLTKRKDFKEKRVKSGTVGGLIKMFNELKLYKKYDYEKVKVYLYDMTIEQLELLKDKQVLMQMLKQTSELYINVDIDKDLPNTTKNKGEGKKTVKTIADIPIYENIEYPFQSDQFKEIWHNWKIYKFELSKFMYASIQSEQSALVKLAKLSKGDEPTAIEIMTESMSNGWAGFFELKNNTKNGNNKQATGGAVDTRSAFGKIDRMFGNAGK